MLDYRHGWLMVGLDDAIYFVQRDPEHYSEGDADYLATNGWQVQHIRPEWDSYAWPVWNL